MMKTAGTKITLLLLASVSTGCDSDNLSKTPINLTSSSVRAVASSVTQASGFPGSDCGAKVNSAFQIGISVSVDLNCGTVWSTPVTVPVGGSLQFLQAESITLSAPITLLQGASIIGLPGGMGDGTNTPSVILKAASSINLTALVNMVGSQASLRDVYLDGNQHATDGVVVSAVYPASAQRSEISHTTVANVLRYGYFFSSTLGHNEAAAPKLLQAHSLNAGAGGIGCVGTTDGFVVESEFENGSSDGIYLHSCGGWRFIGDDAGGNQRYGMYLDGESAVQGGGGANLIESTQFGNNYKVL